MTANRPRQYGRSLLGIIIVLGMIVLAGVVYSFSKWRTPALTASPTQATYSVQRRDLTISVTESGEVKARESIDIKSGVEGSTTILSIVPEGTVITEEDVKNGKVLVELDASELEERATQQEITYAGAEANLTEAKEAYDIQIKQNESDIKAAQLTVKFALMDLEKYLGQGLAQELIERIEANQESQQSVSDLIENMTQDPNDPRWDGAALQSKRDLEAAIKLTNQQLERDRNQLQGTIKLYNKEYVAFAELERDRLAYNRSEIELESARTDVELFLRYDFAKEVERLFSDYEEAKRQLARTVARTRSQEAQAKAKFKSAQATFDLQQERKDRLEKQLNACVIKAPAAGMAVYGSSGDSWYRRREPIEVGSSVYERQKIITIPNTSEMAADVQVHESWVDKVSPGLSVRVTVDAFPDQVFGGEVTKVSPLPDPQSRWMDTGLKVYSTEVLIEGEHSGLKPGMSAKVEIIIHELEAVLCVPIHAVVNREGFKACYLVKGGELELRMVKTGAFNDSFIEITEGLAEGDVISLVPPSQMRQAQKRGVGKREPRREDSDSGAADGTEGARPGEGQRPGMKGGGRPSGGGPGGTGGGGEGRRRNGGDRRPGMRGGGGPSEGSSGSPSGERRGPGGGEAGTGGPAQSGAGKPPASSQERP